MADYQLRLNSVKDILDETIAFLKPYLPLANAHASEFITENHWDRLIPESIRDDLMACTDEELRKLPLLGFVDSEEDAFDHLHVRTTIDKSDTDIGRGEENYKSVAKHELQGNTSVADAANEMVLKCVLNENPYRSDSKTAETTINQSTDIKHFVKNKTSCECSNETEKSGNESIAKETVNDVSSHNQHQQWIHASLRDFCHCAWRNTIDGQRLAVSVTEMVEKLGPADNDSDVFVPTYMNLKKSHEIDIMSDVCAQLLKSRQCTLVSFSMIILKNNTDPRYFHWRIKHEVNV